jgi:hypothetical protein
VIEAGLAGKADLVTAAVQAAEEEGVRVPAQASSAVEAGRVEAGPEVAVALSRESIAVEARRAAPARVAAPAGEATVAGVAREVVAGADEAGEAAGEAGDAGGKSRSDPRPLVSRLMEEK